MEDTAVVEVPSVTIDLVKGHKRHFEAIENSIKDTILNQLIGELGAKSSITIKKELEEAKKMAFGFFVKFHKNMEIVENKYKNIAALGKVLIDENVKFTLLDFEIKQDELDELDLINDLLEIQTKCAEQKAYIATKKMKFHETYLGKL
jgi:hypothetical protein